MTACLVRCLCIDYPYAPLVSTFRIEQLMGGFRKATQEVIKSYCSRIPFFCGTSSLVDSTVVTDEGIDMVARKNSIAVIPAKNSIPAVDAIEQSVVSKLDVEPAVRFRKRCVAQSTGSISCDVPTGIQRLFVTEIRANVAEQAFHHINDSIADTRW